MEHVPAHGTAGAPAPRGAQPAPRQKRQLKRMVTIAAVVVGVLLLGLISWFVYRSSTAATIDTSRYQAVFFTNGQVYFGKLHSVNSGYMKLTDIYYLQAQSNTKDSQNPQQTNDKGSDVQLIKLGNEVHGPEDEMIISKDQILFFENLKSDGRVTDSIKQYQNQKK